MEKRNWYSRNARSVLVSLRVPVALYQILQEEQQRTGVTLTEIINQCIEIVLGEDRKEPQE